MVRQVDVGDEAGIQEIQCSHALLIGFLRQCQPPQQVRARIGSSLLGAALNAEGSFVQISFVIRGHGEGLPTSRKPARYSLRADLKRRDGTQGN